jgi:hypothetical protein
MGSAQLKKISIFCHEHEGHKFLRKSGVGPFFFFFVMVGTRQGEKHVLSE